MSGGQLRLNSSSRSHELEYHLDALDDCSAMKLEGVAAIQLSELAMFTKAKMTDCMWTPTADEPMSLIW